MSSRSPLRQPPWLPPPPDDTYYADSKEITKRVLDTIFNNLSKCPDLNFGLLNVGDPDTRSCIRRRLAHLLPHDNYQYTYSQIAMWNALMDSPMALSNRDLQKVVPMKDYQHPLTLSGDIVPNSRGFFVYSWTMSVSEFDIFIEYLQTEERGFYQLIDWCGPIHGGRLTPDYRFTIRYVGSCAMSEWPNGPTENIYSETEDARSGNLAAFLMAILCKFPTVAATYQCHLIQYVTTLMVDKEGLHDLIHSVLIEFFGTPFVLNRHPKNKASKFFTERQSMVTSLNLRFDGAALKGRLDCPPSMFLKLRNHFKRIKDYLDATQSPDATGTNSGVFRFDDAKCAALVGQSMPQYYKGNRPIMIITGQSMHINDYIHGRPFSFSRDPGNQLVSQLLSHIGNRDLREMCVEPFAYYCLAPWPQHENLRDAIEFMWDYFKIVKPPLVGYQGNYLYYYVDEIGEPIRRQMGEHHFIHVSLMEPSRCRYGVEFIDGLACNFMHTSFVNAMLVADKVMQVLDDYEAIDREMDTLARQNSGSTQGSDPVRREQYVGNNSEAVCSLAMRLYEDFASTQAGGEFRRQFVEDTRVLRTEAQELALFIH
ncbi:hypothetical protein GQX73_g2890 [Xylaria multiplex]|uniref:Uncharacterized protein n=1 Tax=Xylaria multiplex TaxID=323545 RepID=A0A7C8N861_9PEZI|nr:hypothetical protein GQX73_g2890 [Xylaria multiplex]